MAGPEFPDVPKTDGVPDVKRSSVNPGTDVQEAMSSDEITVTGYDEFTWGIFRSGTQEVALQADSFAAFRYDAEHRIADYPIEEGGFESYEKVALPFMGRVVLTKGGTRADRSAFCATLDEIRRDTELYSIVTPEQVFLNANITRVTIDRSAEAGAGMIRAEITLQEIRLGVVVRFSNTRDAASADEVNGGSKQPKTADTPIGDVK